MSLKRKRISNRQSSVNRIHCGQHSGDTCPGDTCVTFENILHFSSNGRLPRNREVLGLLLHLNIENVNQNNIRTVSTLAMYHWILCNVYTIAIHRVESKLKSMVGHYRSLMKVSKNKKGATFLKNLGHFKKELDELFDIKSPDASRLKNQGYFWGVIMEADDHAFYENQKKNPPVGICTTVLDKHSLAKMNRIKRKKETLEKQRTEQQRYETDMLGISLDQIENDDVLEGAFGKDVDPEEQEGPSYETEPIEKARYKYIEEGQVIDDDDDMPTQYRHVREGFRKVKPEVYEVAHTLSSKYHMSRRQVEAAICEVSNVLFGRKFKKFEDNCTFDNDTLPSMTNLVRTGNYLEAMALSSIVDEIMESVNSSVTYSNDGSSQNKVGSYIVQSITIDGKQRTLPAMSIVTESRESIADLEITTLKILSASSGYKYTEKDILSKIKFHMADSTAHNLKVIEKVCEEVGVDDVPKTLLCNVHPLMLFQSKIKEFFDDIQRSFGTQKLGEAFTVEIDFRDENFVIKSIRCLSNFINKENSAKPWNRHTHFSEFISPKTNLSISLKDHRFNRLQDCCMILLHHIDDIANYLNSFENITNNMAIIDRSFVEMVDVLKPLYAAVALLGIHITRPFHSLLLHEDTNYDTLLTAFPKLYDELSGPIASDPSCMLTKSKVFTFVSDDIFKMSQPKDILVNNMLASCDEYKIEICRILKLCLIKFADGFLKQKGAIFGFGSTAADDTGTVLKICEVVDPAEKKLLLKAPLHNLGEERNVGLLNYEIGFRGHKHLETVSQKMVQSKSNDLTRGKFGELKRFRKQASDIKELKYQWTKKMEALQKEGLSIQEVECLVLEKKKLEDLQYLKAQTSIAGPLTSVQELENLLQMDLPDAELNKRLYVEVRYKKNTSTSIKKSSSMFRLKSSGKNLASEDYIQNIKQYFGCISSVNTLKRADLSNILIGLTGANLPNTTAEEILQENTPIESENETLAMPSRIGSHCIAVWEDDMADTNELNWYLGVIESDISDGQFSVSYMVRSGKGDERWFFPERSEVFLTHADQIIAFNIPVEYSAVTIIRCKINKTIVSKIQTDFSQYIRS